MYDTLARIEKQLAAIELDYLRKTYIATRPRFLDRATAIQAIPDFWSTVIDEAPAEIDQRIQPRDVPALSCLTGLDVERFEVKDADNGEPRSIRLTLTFKPNEWFFDNKIEKKFYWRMSHNGWSGLVSEPVTVRWKHRDRLTDGLLDLAVNLWKKELDLETQGCDLESIEEYQTLVERIQRTPQDAVSFFAFLGFRGHRVSAEESAAAMEKAQSTVEVSRETEGSNEESPSLPDSEIYPHGEEVAVALSEDLYPGATHYFTTAKERDTKVSDEELVSDSNDSDNSEESNAFTNQERERRPNKKTKIHA
ncbi:MAG: hypothetical protein L6R38_002563 [Xanthoria sp. 2 TBL-2021]|nr:MAG: hypothetical protein L6R38_002563 [Xanthoria sp. 2 TBL-2021]